MCARSNYYCVDGLCLNYTATMGYSNNILVVSLYHNDAGSLPYLKHSDGNT